MNYSELYRSFQWSRPEHFNFATEVIDHWAQDPGKLAMLWVDDAGNEINKTFADISLASCKLANVLTTAGVKRGDTVVIVLGRQIAWWETVTACLRMGAIVSPGTMQLAPNDLAYRINTAEATCVVTDSVGAAKLDKVLDQCPSLNAKLHIGGERAGWVDFEAAVEQASDDFVAADTGADEPALCYFTSGTTGYPKMAMHAQSYGLAHSVTGKYWLDLKPDDVHWNISDTGWAKAAWSSYFGPWNCGAAIFVHHSSGFNADQTLKLMSQYPVTTVCGAPTIYRMLVQQNLSQYDFASLRHCVAAGEPLNPEVINVWKKATGITVRDGYGQTETVILCGNFPGIEPRFGSMGKPTPGIDLQVIDHEGNIAAVNTEGDIAVRVKPQRPLGLFKEYKNQPEKTAKCFKGDWYLTGDRAYVDEDGYFWFVSRSDDVILSSGYRIGPFEVESALLEHPAVAESAVVSSPDKDRGEVVKAFVVLVSGYEANDLLSQELKTHVKTVTAPYKYPRKIEFVTELPKTISGKIRRIELREREWRDQNTGVEG